VFLHLADFCNAPLQTPRRNVPAPNRPRRVGPAPNCPVAELAAPNWPRRIGGAELSHSGIDVVKDCKSCFAVDLPSCVLKRRQDKFILQLYFYSEWFLPILQQVVILN